jgi:hypothetical protein
MVHNIHLLIHQTQTENCNLRYQSHENQRSPAKGLYIDGRNHEGRSRDSRTLIARDRYIDQSTSTNP